MKLVSAAYLACVVFVSTSAFAATESPGKLNQLADDERERSLLHEIIQEMISHQKDMSIVQHEQVAMYISSLEGRIVTLEGDANGSPKRGWLEYFAFGAFCFAIYQIYEMNHSLNSIKHSSSMRAAAVHPATSWTMK